MNFGLLVILLTSIVFEVYGVPIPIPDVEEKLDGKSFGGQYNGVGLGASSGQIQFGGQFGGYPNNFGYYPPPSFNGLNPFGPQIGGGFGFNPYGPEYPGYFRPPRYGGNGYIPNK